MKILLAVLAFVLLQFNCMARNPNLNDVYRALDSTLAKTGLKYHDFQLVGDYASGVSSRISEIDSAFTSPFNLFEFSAETDRLLEEFSQGKEGAFCARTFETLNFGRYNYSKLNQPVTSQILKDYFGANIDSAANFASQMVARQFLSAIYSALSNLEQNPATIDINKYVFITQYYDSVFLQLESAEESDFFKSARKEKAFRQNEEIFFKYAKSFEKSTTYSIGFSLYDALLEINEKNFGLPSVIRDSIKTFEIETKYGKVAIGGYGDDLYKGDYLLIVDFGGNDTYLLKDRDKFKSLQRPVTAIIDYSGNDNYIAGNYNLGGTAFGVNILIDYSGDDNYIAKNVSLGAALFGVGILSDFAGNDSYKGDTFTQASAAFGFGLLLDYSGSDSYISNSNSQGFASTSGFAALLDKAGDDSYLAQSKYLDNLRYENRYTSFSQGASLGVRPFAAGGIAYLIDNAGNDVYKCDVFGQGVAYWFGLGGLIDKAGDDRYLSHQYAQGSGIHFGFGLLMDYAGNDNYQTFSVSQGCGHDFGFGSLIDFAGNDRYTADNLSLGGGNANAVSLFMDLKGNDSYFAANPNNSFGFCDIRRNVGAPGLFIDASGVDYYQDVSKNNSYNEKNSFGFFYDFENNELQKIESPQNEKHQKPARSSNMNDLFFEASASALSEQPYVESAVKNIAQKPQEAVKLIEENITTRFPRERKAIEDILVEVNINNPKIAEDFLVKLLKTNSETKLVYAIDLAARIKNIDLLPLVASQSTNVNWRVRASAAQAMGDLYLAENDSALAQLLHDKNTFVRSKAAYSLSKNIKPESIALLQAAQSDAYYSVRYGARLGLNQGDSLTKKIITRAMKTEDSDFIKIFSLLDKEKIKKSELKKLKSKILKESVENRKLIYQKLLSSDNKKFSKLIKDLIKSEKNKDLKSLLKNS